MDFVKFVVVYVCVGFERSVCVSVCVFWKLLLCVCVDFIMCGCVLVL